MPTIEISSPPPFVSPEEHRELIQSTPSSFQDIPPVLRHKEQNVRVTLEPPLSSLHHEALAGSLYVTESVLAFISTSGAGFQIDYPSITLHAISRSDSGPSIYCQLDETPEGLVLAEDEENEMRELTIIPENASSLEPIFEALSLCAALHPDKNSASDDEMDDGMFADADESGGFETFTGASEEELSEVGRAALEHLESIIVYPVSRQEDGTDQHLSTSDEEQADGTDSPSLLGTGLPNGTH